MSDLFVDGEGDPLELRAAEKQKRKRRRSAGRLIGCPVPWFIWVLPRTGRSKDQLIMALYLYRRCCVCDSNTVTVPNDEVAELLDLSRWGKYRALVALERAGVLQREEHGKHTAKVRLCHWPDPPL